MSGRRKFTKADISAFMIHLRNNGWHPTNDCPRAFDMLECLQARVDELEGALTQIANNSCCDKCQEAALVARAALRSADDGGEG